MCAPCVIYDSRCMSIAIIFGRRLPIVLHASTSLHVSPAPFFRPFICWMFQEYSVQLTFREQWTDERLKFNDFGGRLKYLTLTEANRVWMPDLFFSNEKEGHFHNIIMPNVYIRIFPYGSVLYSIRYRCTFYLSNDLTQRRWSKNGNCWLLVFVTNEKQC